MIQIFVDVVFINMQVETYLLEVETNTTITDAKKMILEKTCVYPEEQIWFTNNGPVKNTIEWDKKLKYSIIVDSKWYNFEINSGVSIISVTNLTSRDEISTLKYHIYKKTNLIPDKYSLIYKKNGRNMIELKDYEKIGKYFIPNNATINLIIKINSGLR